LRGIERDPNTPQPVKRLCRVARIGTIQPRTPDYAAAFQDIGPAAIKLGQSLATRPDLVGEDAARNLLALQDDLAPLPFKAIHAEIARSFDAPVETFFSEIDPVPVGSASIAQVHRAEVATPAEVAVKVLRPGVAAVVDADLSWLLPVVRFLSRQGVEVAGPLHQYFGGLRQQICEELDLRNEAAAMDRFRALYEQHHLDLIVIPRVHPDLSGRTTLTMELLDGVPIDDPAATDWGDVDPRPLLLALMKAWFTTAVLDGVFHGDLHAGNLLLLRDGRLGLIDFGILGRLDPATHWIFRRMLEGCLGDPDAWKDVAEGYRRAGVSMQDDFGLSDGAAATIVRSQIEPILTRAIGHVDLAKIVVTSKDVARAAHPENSQGGGRESLRQRAHRIRVTRRFSRRVVDARLREKPFDRANFLLGKQLMYVERFGKMYLADTALLDDRPFIRKLLRSPGPPSPLAPEAAADAFSPPG